MNQDFKGKDLYQEVNELMPEMYEILRSKAHFHRMKLGGKITLNTTEVVHEAYEKLVSSTDKPFWRDRSHFLRIAARTMRFILIDYIRTRNRDKRGGSRQNITLNEKSVSELSGGDETLQNLHEALGKLESISPRHVAVVECRFFAGYSIEETSEALSISPATVKRDWILARTWLYKNL
jgi:RNA polymerase sigma factor (TIGR02999 family)